MSQPMLREFWQNRRRSAGLTERNALDPVCTSLLRKQYTDTVHTCHKILRNRPYWPIVQTLLSIAYWHTHDWKAALLVADEVSKDTKGKGKSPQDEDIITLLSWLYARLKKHTQATQLWQNATSAKGDDLNLLLLAVNFYTTESLYAASIRANKQVMNIIPNLLKTGTLNSIKLTEEGRQELKELSDRSFWHSALAVILQHKDHVADAAEHVARYADMLRQHVNISNEPENVQSSLHTIRTHHQYYLLIRLYKLHLDNLKVAEDTGYGDVRNQLMWALHSELGNLRCSQNLNLELLRREIVLQHGTSQHLDTLWQRMTTALQAKDFNWSTVDTMISAALLLRKPMAQANGLSASRTKSVDDSGDCTHRYIAQTKILLEELAGGDEQQGSSREERGYTLGLLKLASQADPASIGKYVKLYFTRHCDKACCFDDLTPYLPELVKSEESTSDVLGFLANLKYNSQQSLITVENIVMTVNADKLHRALQTAPSLDAEVKYGKVMAQAYFATSHLAANLTETDLHPSDDFALLSAHAWVSAYSISKLFIHLESAAAILIIALKSSKYRYQLRVLLIRILRMMGASTLVLQHHTLLNPIQTQIDSISHFAFERGSTLVLSAMPPPGKAGMKESEQPKMLNELQRMVSWYSQAVDEANNSIVGAWNDEVYAIIEDHEAFQSRLQYSLVRQSLLQEAIRVQTMTGVQDAKDRPHISTTFALSMEESNFAQHDNRDYSVLPDLQPIRTSSIHSQTQISNGVSAQFLRCLGQVYESFFDIGSYKPLAVLTIPQEATTSEGQLLEWAKNTLVWLVSDDITTKDEDLVVLFKTLQQEITAISANDLPWTTLHIAQTALEAYALFDTAYASIASRTHPHKKIKKIRQIRQDAKAALKSISSRLKALVEDLSKHYKGKQKLVSLAWLRDFEQVSESQVMDIATQVLEARKGALSSMAVTIVQRIAGA